MQKEEHRVNESEALEQLKGQMSAVSPEKTEENGNRFLDDALGCVVGAAVLYVVYVTAFLIHLYTLYIAATESGFMAMLSTLLAPVISEIYWFIRVTASMGIVNPYSIIILGWVISFIFILLCCFIQKKRGKAL